MASLANEHFQVPWVPEPEFAPYRGRFAPSPTGPLHRGSLLAAVGSYLDARARGGQWLLRIEDLDRDREQPGACDAILRALEAFGFEWDGPVVYQSQRLPLYEAALQQLQAQGLAYPCACSRRQVAEAAVRGLDGPVYPGTCRQGLPAGQSARAWRLRVSDEPIAVMDRLQPRQQHRLDEVLGDFVVRRAEGYFAYQLAVVVDDAAQGISHVVRGSDLLDSTSRQIYLQQCLGYPAPIYLHLPILVNNAGEKLSKQTRAQALSGAEPVRELHGVLQALGQAPPAELMSARLGEFWSWAQSNWQPDRLPRAGCLAETAALPLG